MKIPHLPTDNRGVSSVVGIILVVALTVILAAVLASFVIGIGEDLEKTPQASLAMESAETETNNNTIIYHNGGDTLQISNLNVTVEGTSVGIVESGTFSPGEQITTNGSGGETGEVTLKVIHNSSGGTIAESAVTLP